MGAGLEGLLKMEPKRFELNPLAILHWSPDAATTAQGRTKLNQQTETMLLGCQNLALQAMTLLLSGDEKKPLPAGRARPYRHEVPSFYVLFGGTGA